MASSAREYIEAAKSYDSSSPMWSTAIAVCQLRGIDPCKHEWFQGELLARWQLVIIESMMIYSMAEETTNLKTGTAAF